MFSVAQNDLFSMPKYLITAVLAFAYAFLADWHETDLDGFIAFYFCSLLLSWVAGGMPGYGMMGQYTSYFTGVFPMLLVLAAFQAGIGASTERVYTCIYACILVSALVAIAQKMGLWILVPLRHGRVEGLSGSPVFFSCALALGLVIGEHMKYRLANLVLAVALLFTDARAGMLAAGVGLLVLSRNKRAIIMASIAAIAVMAYSYGGRKSKSDQGRFEMARIAMMSWSKSPAYGHGPESFFRQLTALRDKQLNDKLGESYNNSYAHNALLESLSSTGIIGTFSLFLLLTVICSFLLHIGRYDMLAMFGAVGTFSMFQPTPLYVKTALACALGTLYVPSPRPRWQTDSVAGMLLAGVVCLGVMTWADRLYAVGAKTGDGIATQKATAVLASFAP